MILTRWGEPEPWSVEEVKSFLDGMTEELKDKRRHTYMYTKRVWAQKPFDKTSA